MSDKPEDGGPAFPNVPDGAGDKWADWDKGMTLRDYFAAHALAGLLVRNWGDPKTGITPDDVHELWAAGAYATADAMLRARSNTTT